MRKKIKFYGLVATCLLLLVTESVLSQYQCKNSLKKVFDDYVFALKQKEYLTAAKLLYLDMEPSTWHSPENVAKYHMGKLYGDTSFIIRFDSLYLLYTLAGFRVGDVKYAAGVYHLNGYGRVSESSDSVKPVRGTDEILKKLSERFQDTITFDSVARIFHIRTYCWVFFFKTRGEDGWRLLMINGRNDGSALTRLPLKAWKQFKRRGWLWD